MNVNASYGTLIALFIVFWALVIAAIGGWWLALILALLAVALGIAVEVADKQRDQ